MGSGNRSTQTYGRDWVGYVVVNLVLIGVGVMVALAVIYE